MVVDLIHQTVFSYLDSLDCSGSRFFVGFSGGVDSKVLLLVCQAYCKTRLNVSIEAVHVNHHLHPDADAWAGSCVDFCVSHRLAYRVISVAVAEPDVSAGLELRAREARYQAFSQAVSHHDSGILLLAHHAQDQWETVMMRLAQGTGLAGLLGMKMISTRRDMMVVRPMLGLSRRDCESYLHAFGFTGITDSSNTDEAFTRGFIRKHLTPVMSTRWPQFAVTVSKQSRIWAEDFAAMDACVQQVLVQVTMHYYGLPYLSVEKLQHYPISVCVVLLKSWLRAEGYSSPSHSKLISFVAQTQQARGDRRPHLIHGSCLMTIDRGRIFLLPVSAKDNASLGSVSRSSAAVMLANHEFVWCVNCPDNIEDSYRQEWDRFSLANLCAVWHRSGKSKRKLLQSLRVPWFLHGFYPVFLRDNTVVAAVGKTLLPGSQDFYSLLRVGLKVQHLCSTNDTVISTI